MGFNFTIRGTQTARIKANDIDLCNKPCCGIDFINLQRALEKGVVKVTFTKANGELREMDATLAAYLLPETHQESNHPKGETMVVFDLDAEGWRSFRKDRVISVEEY